MTNFTINAQTQTGKTLEELANQIARRVQILNETTERAVTAITINVLKSLRAMTPKFKGDVLITNSIVDEELGIAVKQSPQYVVGFKTVGKKVFPCVRIGNKKGQIANVSTWFVTAKADYYNAKVFEVELSKGRQDAWPKKKAKYYVVAYSLEHAMSEVKNRYNKQARRYSGAAKGVLTKAMMLASNRNAKIETTTNAGLNLANRNAVVSKSMIKTGFGSGDYQMTVSDNLRYSGKIVPNNAVTIAQMKALNSVNGYINRWIDKFDPSEHFNEKQETPFPPEAFNLEGE